MNKDLLTLYAVFDLLNNQEISHSPSMSNPATYDFTSILKYLEDVQNNKKELTFLSLMDMTALLNETNNCYYQESELRQPIRINNCPYLELINNILEKDYK